jgi:hypothetical protein
MEEEAEYSPERSDRVAGDSGWCSWSQVSCYLESPKNDLLVDEEDSESEENTIWGYGRTFR